MICKKVGTVKVPHIVNGIINEMMQCGKRIYWEVIVSKHYVDSYGLEVTVIASRYYVDSDGRKVHPDCPGVMRIYYIPVFLPPGIDDAPLWLCDLNDYLKAFLLNSFVTPINLDAIIEIAAKLNLVGRLLHFLYNSLSVRNTPLEEICRRCVAGDEGDEESTSLAVCLICRRLYGTEVAPTRRLVDELKSYLRYDMRQRVWDRLADAIDTTLTKEEFNEIIDGIFAVNGDFDKVSKRWLDILADVWEWI